MFSIGVIPPSWLVPISEHQELALWPLHDLALARSHDEDMLSGWVDPVPDPLLLRRNLVTPGIEPGPLDL
jgi:hypothetical protein